MSESYPSQIAKYLLKGWCLMNEYCDNGHNTPMLKSREGVLICVACEVARGGEAAIVPSCSVQTPSAGEPEPSPSPAVNGACPGTPAKGRPPMMPHTMPFLPECRATASRSSNLDSPPVDFLEVVLNGSDLQFSCTRLARRCQEQRLRLLGDHFSVKVRFPAQLDADSLAVREAARTSCERLGDRIVLPRLGQSSTRAEVSIEEGSEEIEICFEGKKQRRFVFPREDCLLIPGSQVTPDALASLIWEDLEKTISTRLSSQEVTRWLEVSIVDSAGQETTIRRVPRRHA
eukprot:TRINITY_DN1855_c1_g1_i1.p1 TRINITY_DN1855_c1_g1~~TRINITY_DN1855_c1_g1_i1.p1  ORF type:complete len:330 (-),score=21.95 TRINITY_DN1855_c1_g1_i1:106-969(-)